MLTKQDIMEELSHVYVHAIAAKVGYKYEKASQPDRDSIDATIRAKGMLTIQTVYLSAQLDLQLKSTTNIHETDAHFTFDLPIKNYDELRKSRTTSILLVVLFLPKDCEEWVTHNEDELISKKCAYWASLKGNQESDNTSTVRINIPKINVFSPTNLVNLMQEISIKGDL